MRRAGVIVALLLCAGGALEAQSEPAWHFDAAATVLLEAWDLNENTEWLSGVIVGGDRRVWRGVAIRGEVLALRVMQQGR